MIKNKPYKRFNKKKMGICPSSSNTSQMKGFLGLPGRNFY
jgi:hypothetical protein